ncbi:hypothetical protein AWR27_12720 [Spirosoma montaniterrae]|uniref:Gliding motility-associated C-terminal domain-containing protein n=1 Tax=Spirosoma montaniterrae TaxID=1178516 RepID=A0A1P9WXM9_9BACT|nr:gliding motility-associated C-terminal domain-containing protein [Spirosoma montaniterrae]AQG80113.1 hypothetical protein AWR27_12720 [Spirosoma montaniterrae]
MRFIYTIGLFALFLVALVEPVTSYATHVRAGEITTRRISATSLTYEITLTAYYDEVDGALAAAQGADEYTICFGDGTSALVRRDPKRFINGRTSSINVYRVVHTYPGPDTYTVSVTIPNRNNDTKNLPPANQSQNISFHVSTTILINPGLGLNSTPVMLNPPLDSGRVGQRFCHNPAAFDADGDSLAFRLSVPKEGLAETCPRSRNIPAYQDPTRFSRTSETGGSPTFTIDPRTGELCWDAPGEEGQFNFAFIVEEWRNGVLIGEITRDMQIIVVDQTNRRPLLQPLPELCREAGSLISVPVSAADPDNNRVIISGFGGVFNVGPDGRPLAAGELIAPDYARLSSNGLPQNQPATSTFTWQTNCNHIRSAPYDVTFKVGDVPTSRSATSLVAFQTLRIRIVGPSVKNLTARPTATTQGRAIQLSWSPYACAPTGAEGQPTRLLVYRREGCTPVTSETCTTGPPPGYSQIAELPVTATTFTDTASLRRGVAYSYVLVARYPDRNGGFNGGMSLPSAPVCQQLPLLMPVITQVTIDSTDAQRGQITLRWSRPIGLAPGDLTGPFQYRIQRATGLDGTAFQPLTTITTTLEPTTVDTVFVDKGSSTSALNTTANAYRYRIEFFYTTNGQFTRLDVTEAASSVRLSSGPGPQRSIALRWQTNTPWSNDNQPHRIFRSRSGPNGPFNEIAQVNVQAPPTYVFTDDGSDRISADGNTSRPLSADSAYCYRVLTRGRYTDAQLTGLGSLTNLSQTLCAQPADTTRPCPPALRLDSLNCASVQAEQFCTQTNFQNQLRWSATSGPTCDSQVVGYRIYYGRYEQDSLRLLTEVATPTTSYAHQNLTTVSGCYYVTALSRRGQESRPSNRVCNNACAVFALPNVFTPNGDGKNDVFSALRCAAFVEEVRLVVYNRWGAKVYEGTSRELSWDGRSSEGRELPTGLYYYEVQVRFSYVDRNAPPNVYKGWVQILREGNTQG